MKNIFDQIKDKAKDFERINQDTINQAKQGYNNMKYKYENSDFAKKFEYEKQNINRSQNQQYQSNQTDKQNEYQYQNTDLKKKLYNFGYNASVYAQAVKKVVQEQNIPQKMKNLGDNIKQKAQQQHQQNQQNRGYQNYQNNYNYSNNQQYNNNNNQQYNSNNNSNYYNQYQNTSNQFYSYLRNKFSGIDMNRIYSYRPVMYLKIIEWLRYNKVLAIKLILGSVFVYGVATSMPRAIAQYMVEKQRLEKPVTDPQYQEYLMYKRQKEREEIENGQNFNFSKVKDYFNQNQNNDGSINV